MEPHKVPNCQKILRKRNKAGSVILSILQIQTLWYQQKHTHISMEQNRELKNKHTPTVN